MFTWYYYKRRDFHSGARWKVAPCLHKAVFVGVRVVKIDETLMDMKRTVIPRFHDTRKNFLAGMKISLRHKNRGELAPVWLAPAWLFVLVSCKQIQSHIKEGYCPLVTPTSGEFRLGCFNVMCFYMQGPLWTIITKFPYNARSDWLKQRALSEIIKNWIIG